jgi:hypothetical protein
MNMKPWSIGAPVKIVKDSTCKPLAVDVAEKVRLIDLESGETREFYRIDAQEILESSSRYKPADQEAEETLRPKQKVPMK